MADGDLLNSSSVNVSSTTEGIILPQATSCASGTAEGQVCWDSDNDVLYAGNGTAALQLGSFMVSGQDAASISSTTAFGFFGSEGQISRLPVAARCFNLYVDINVAPSAGDSWTITLRDDGVNTSLTCPIADAAIACSDTSNVTDVIAAGSAITVNFVEAGTATATNGETFGFQCIPN